MCQKAGRVCLKNCRKVTYMLQCFREDLLMALRYRKVKKTMAKKKIYKDYDEFLSSRLKDPELALGYLNELLKTPDDQKNFLAGLKDVANAQSKDIASLAKETNITRQNVYRILSATGNPRWNNLRSLCDALGFTLQLSPKESQ